MRNAAIFLAIAAVSAGTASAQLIVNPPQTITERVNVNVISVADDAGANPAPLFGTPLQQSSIFDMIDTIWAQAGIDVAFDFRAGTYDSTFALSGNVGNNSPRPTGDLSTIVTDAGNIPGGGVLSADPNTINLFMVVIVPGFSFTSVNTANGLAFRNINGITMWSGSALPGFSG